MCRLSVLVVCGVGSQALGVDVLVMSSGSSLIDDAVVGALTSEGHSVTLGPEYAELESGEVLAGHDVVYMQANFNWLDGAMPEGGQQALLEFVEKGGGIVTSEWVLWKWAAQGSFEILGDAFPCETVGAFTTTDTTQYNVVTFDEVLSEGLIKLFTFPNDSFSGTETFISPKPGAVLYYNSSTADAGVVGWSYAGGRALSISTTAGQVSYTDSSFVTLMGNAMDWAALGGDVKPPCPADCNGDGVLNILDFVCFQGLFQSGDDDADFNGDGVLNILDFVAFQGAFVEGCP